MYKMDKKRKKRLEHWLLKEYINFNTFCEILEGTHVKNKEIQKVLKENVDWLKAKKTRSKL